MSEGALTAVIPNCVIAYAIASHISLKKFMPTKGAAHTQRLFGQCETFETFGENLVDVS